MEPSLVSKTHLRDDCEYEDTSLRHTEHLLKGPVSTTVHLSHRTTLVPMTRKVFPSQRTISSMLAFDGKGMVRNLAGRGSMQNSRKRGSMQLELVSVQSNYKQLLRGKSGKWRVTWQQRGHQSLERQRICGVAFPYGDTE
jgi:hypothetical protein